MQLDCRGGSKNDLFINISLTSLVKEFETILEKVKDRKLYHLIEPIETTTTKLRELNELEDRYRCQLYGDHLCPVRDFCHEKNEKKSQEDTLTSESSCVCWNSQGERSCHCGSSSDSVAVKKLESNLHKTETYCIKDASCKCPIDLATGRSLKSPDCKLARREMREARKTICESRPKTADAKLTSALEPDVILLDSAVSQSMIKVEANWPEKTFKFTKEDTHLESNLAMERAISCNITSDSSSEQLTLTSSDDTCQVLDYQRREEAPCISATFSDCRYPNKKSNCCDSDSYLDACGCGRTVNNSSLVCPCGCGDFMELPKNMGEQRTHCRCENCGKKISEGQEAVKCRAPRAKEASNSACGTADIQEYIVELEEQCRKKDKIITKLQDKLSKLNEGY